MLPRFDPSVRTEVASGLAGADGVVRPIGERVVLQRHWGDAQVIAIESGEGGHGGGDVGLLQDVFRGPNPDQLGRSGRAVSSSLTTHGIQPTQHEAV